MINYDSGIFALNLGGQDVPGGAVFNGQDLVYTHRIGGYLSLIVCSPPSGQDPWTVVSPESKGGMQCWSQGGHGKGTGIAMTAGLSTPAVYLPNPSTGTADIYVMSGNSQIFHMIGPNYTTIETITIASINGTSLSSVSATAWGSYLLLGWFNTGANMLMWEVYDPASLPSPVPPGFIWTPTYEAGGVPGIFQLPNSSVLPSNAFGPVPSMDWFAWNGNCYLVTSMMVGTTPALFVNQMGTGPLPSQIGGVYPTLVITEGLTSGQVMVARDPAGRMTLSGCNGTNPVATTLTIPNVADPFGTSSAWSAPLDNWTNVTGANASQSQVTTWVMGQTYNDSNNIPCQDIFQVCLYPDGKGQICANIQSFGTAQAIVGAVSGQLLPQLPPFTAPGPPPQLYTGMVSGIIDAPFPMPASNIQNNFNKGYLNPGALLGTVQYGVTQESETSHSVNLSVGAGFTYSGTTTMGIGPNWSISLNAASTMGSGDETATAIVNGVPFGTNVSADGSSVEPYGGCFANNVSYTGTYYRVLDVNGNAFSEGNSPTCQVSYSIAVFPQGLNTKGGTFTPYLVIPGDLASYTREAINAAAIGIGLAAEGSDYVAEVIEQNALQFTTNQNYLLWSQEYNSKSAQGYLSTQTSWTESGWTMNFSDYVGIGSGCSVTVPFESQPICSIQTSFMVGINVSTSHSTTETQETQVQIVINMNVPIPLEPTDIKQLSVAIYFLPANALWMSELASYSGLIFTDTNSLPWRIFFLVTSYESQDGTIQYPPAA